MRDYKATFWRSNPQLKNGGRETDRTIAARSAASARKKAIAMESRTLYGGMTLLKIEEIK